MPKKSKSKLPPIFEEISDFKNAFKMLDGFLEEISENPDAQMYWKATAGLEAKAYGEENILPLDSDHRYPQELALDAMREMVRAAAYIRRACNLQAGWPGQKFEPIKIIKKY